MKKCSTLRQRKRRRRSTCFGDLATIFAEDSTGRSSGLQTVDKPVTKKKHRSGKKGKALDCVPVAAAYEDVVVDY